MTASALSIDVPPVVLFATLTDVASYPEWLVGAKHIRGIDGHWPEPGSTFHHRVGFGPLTIADSTSVVALREPTVLVLEARIGPLGAARVQFTVTADDRGGSHLSIEEEPVSGLMRLLWNPLTRPLVAVGLWGRNAVSLQALRALAERRSEAGAG